ncbi:MAG: helix-turn-helix domain-containing protein [Treponema sp.]|jgi:transcriptional regulator with XRE-family HTH domain|nr:helix-turn-helix domain-containing protein [Treponema sp.]
MENTFRENLRSELEYQGVTVKELSAKTGIPKPTLECYVGKRATTPPADRAVRIAAALGVTVEFLVAGIPAGRGEARPKPVEQGRLFEMVNDLKKKSMVL